ncbi:uncharacterized protein LOC115629473 [Scaptodrosophila lebanonensis]|uniref:Uncharacterized protein LOC115629473 n=1 Tax=Drosophila lebanonensis TaxID=7225 RepID=A0A6J2U0D0_DROLE|nr:uncharacterized protein LOC115629473 [Scaptodrosophila lebanonensis]
MHKLAIILALVLYLNQKPIFIETPLELCSNALHLQARWIFILATTCLLWQMDLRLRQLHFLPVRAHLAVETGVSLMLMELSGNVIWCSMDSNVSLVIHLLCNFLFMPAASVWRELLETLCCWLSTMVLSIVALNRVLLAAHFDHHLTRIVPFLHTFWLGFRGFLTLNPVQQRNLIRIIQMQRQRRRQTMASAVGGNVAIQ